jgi:hypothetical protein
MPIESLPEAFERGHPGIEMQLGAVTEVCLSWATP